MQPNPAKTTEWLLSETRAITGATAALMAECDRRLARAERMLAELVATLERQQRKIPKGKPQGQ